MQPPDDSQIAADAAFAKRLLGTDEPGVNVADAYERTFVRARREKRRWLNGVAATGVAAAVVAALLLTPLGGYAMQLLTIFEPKEFVPIAISAKDSEQLRLVPSLTSFGTVTANSDGVLRHAASLAAARAAAGFVLRQPSNARSLPAGPVTYFVVPARTVAFTFSAAKARAYENDFHRHLPPMPRDLDGSTIRMHVGPSIAIAYGPLAKRYTGGLHSGVAEGLAIVQMRVPRITSTRASIEELEAYLLSMPNVPADVAAQLRMMSSPSEAMPIPFRIDKTIATAVAVDGTRGLAIGDQTGLGSGVVWQKGGMIYAIGGSLKETDALTLANGLR